MFDRALEAAIASYKKHRTNPRIKNHSIIVVVDFTQHSSKQRLYVYDRRSKKVVRDHHVAHGTRSSATDNAGYAVSFSNKVGSRMSSRGAMVTGKTYRWGVKFPTPNKLKLHGLEKGVNNHVFRRAIVVHSSWYCTDDYIRRRGRLGCSWGCFAVDPAIAESLIDLIKEGVFVYVYGKEVEGYYALSEI